MRIRRTEITRRAIGSKRPCAVLLALAALLAPARASGFAITDLAVAPESLNTANQSFGSLFYRQRLSSTSVVTAPGGPAPDVAGSTLSFTARYAATTTSDLDTGGSPLNFTARMDYSISFTVEDPLDLGYEMEIDTRRVGAVTSFDDVPFVNAVASATLSSVSATLDGDALSGLGLPSGSWSFSIPGNGATENEPFDQASGPVVVAGSGTQSFVLRFTSTNDSVTSNSGDVAIRMGLAGTLSGTTAHAYPGTDGRVLSDDGHFVTVTVTTLVPEPASALLLTAGLLGLAVRGNRRQR